MKNSAVELIEYTKRQDLLNCLTHATGALLGAAVLGVCLYKTVRIGSPRLIVCAVIYGLSLVLLYTASAVYHGLPAGELKRTARLVDHSVIPVLIAGTATPCAMATLFRYNLLSCVVVMTLAWGSVIFGLVSKLFFFEKTGTATVVVYIAASVIMLSCSLSVIEHIDLHALFMLVLGCAVYLFGALFCALGRKRPYFHALFHIIVVVGSMLHAWTIYAYVLE